jgi:hypothetical protein
MNIFMLKWLGEIMAVSLGYSLESSAASRDKAQRLLGTEI